MPPMSLPCVSTPLFRTFAPDLLLAAVPPRRRRFVAGVDSGRVQVVRIDALACVVLGPVGVNRVPPRAGDQRFDARATKRAGAHFGQGFVVAVEFVGCEGLGPEVGDPVHADVVPARPAVRAGDGADGRVEHRPAERAGGGSGFVEVAAAEEGGHGVRAGVLRAGGVEVHFPDGDLVPGVPVCLGRRGGTVHRVHTDPGHVGDRAHRVDKGAGGEFAARIRFPVAGGRRPLAGPGPQPTPGAGVLPRSVSVSG
ncbi:hypothetical protein [Embleya sp. MST-111070]|uniref:hypothetical protein n=1 Tax=Embleya sp. MST-111070 TaxID=3398231 RepID=UPI003F73B3C7